MLAEISFQVTVLVVLGCTLLGLLFLAFEVLVAPGVGVPGVIGTLLLFGGIIFAVVARGPLVGLATLASVGVILYFAAQTVGFSLGQRLIHRGQLDPVEDQRFAGMIGEKGVALSPLRPAGVGRFGIKRMDVITRGEFIEKSTKLVVVDVKGSQLTVEASETT